MNNNFREIEKKWQNYWKENDTFKTEIDKTKEKYYMLVEFPYPSGTGLHVGHARVYTASDVLARYKRARGYNVLFPMGWDAFGAPAEQYAIKNHVHPKQAVLENIDVFKGQMESLGLSIDWSREFSTTDPDYYKWTQWQFLQFYKNGLAYKDEKEINWCPNCKMGLSNEDAQGGVCERCGTETTKKLKNQWLLRMSDYSEKLLDGLKDTNFLDKVKTAQINWIGKSVGAEVDFKLAEASDYLKVFTTRCDTLYGVTFMVISPEHKYLDKYKDLIKNKEEVDAYRDAAKRKSEIERTDATKEKTGIKLEGLHAVNPVNNEEIPIYVSDYVLANYGTGAIMAVPAHDERDYAFAKKFNILIKPVIAKYYFDTENPPKENIKTVKTNNVVIVCKHPTENKYLTVTYNKFGWRTFPLGGIEVNETEIEAAKRELREETGYTSFNIERVSDFKYFDEFYAAHKGVNKITTNTIVYGKLDDLAQEEISEEEKNIQTYAWVDANELKSYLTISAHIDIANIIENGETAYTGDGVHINSDVLDGLDKNAAIDKMLEFLEEKKIGQKKINYKLQDWIFSRQRFWGEPIPMINCPKCGWVPVPESELPVILPDVESYEPTDNGESPLANVTDWVNTTCPCCKGPATRETDTMPNWAGSSWYWLRYADPKNDKEMANYDKLKYWGKVDLYDGGMEHATRHLLYARFWNIFLYEQGLVPNSEPFDTRISHGMILGPNGEKMSKSKGNVINPNDMVSEYGADALRVYEMFIGDYTKDAAWNENGLKGCKKFLDRVVRSGEKLNSNEGYTKELESIIHKTIKKVTCDLESLSCNTCVSAMMILLNEYDKFDTISKEDYRVLLQLLNPFAPHITEELNEKYNLGKMLASEKWPIYDDEKTIDDTIEIGIQIGGKLRGSISIKKDASKEEVEELALSHENVIKHTEGKEIVKVIVVPNRIVNIVVK